MADAGILSAPVLDAVEGHPATNWLGFLDVSDIVTALLKGAPLQPMLLALGKMQLCFSGIRSGRAAVH